jgi:hypothetical protein
MSETLRKVLIGTAVGFAIAVLVWYATGLFRAEGLPNVLRIMSDGFFVAAVILLGSGGMVWTYNGGVMDGLGFTFKTMIDRMRGDYADRRQTFMEYREQREAKASSPKYLLLSGLVHLVLAIIVVVIYLVTA